MRQEEQQYRSGVALALGNFDGLHRGHASVLAAAKAQAESLRLTPGVLLFDEHPKQVLCGEAPPLLMTGEEKRARLESAGFTVLTLPFRKIRDLSPAAFLSLLETAYGVRAVSCGSNYRFGQNAAGTADTLRDLCLQYEMTLTVVPDALYKNERISSTRIRRAIEDGDMADANAMLLFPFSYALPVIAGDKRGRRLGFPTLNQLFPTALIRPRAGVYASFASFDGKRYPSVTNVGVRPTIGGTGFYSETHIFDFSGDLYGKTVEVTLLAFLRDEQKFKDLAALRAAMENDAARAKEVIHRYEQTTEAASEGSLL
ncbi:MAG: riboflavin biosynthesis protein RibF [Clostridia bacterium]|nr:riboflavin biosynthesis protein RibF [Clostridia bacterium]